MADTWNPKDKTVERKIPQLDPAEVAIRRCDALSSLKRATLREKTKRATEECAQCAKMGPFCSRECEIRVALAGLPVK